MPGLGKKERRGRDVELDSRLRFRPSGRTGARSGGSSQDKDKPEKDSF